MADSSEKAKNKVKKTQEYIPAGSNFNPIDAFNILVGSYYDYKKTVETERSKRLEIKANLKEKLEEVKTKRDIFMTYLDRSFEERKENFTRLFDVLDRAIDKDDIQTMAHTLNSITELGKSSPFKDLADISRIRQKLNSGEKFEF